MSDHVTITRQPGAALASFDTISASQSEMVFWKNQDNVAHLPTFSTGTPPPALTSQVGPHATSGSLQPSLAVAQSNSNGPLPLTQGQGFPASYRCSLHPGETGTIICYADFYPLPSQLATFPAGAPSTANLITGGLSPYTFTVSNSDVPASLTVTIANPLQGPVLTGTPAASDAGNFAFDLFCQDSGGNNVTQTYLVTVK